MNNSEIGLRLQEARKAAGLSQAQASQVTGIFQNRISHIENGTGCNSKTLAKFARAYAVSTDWLLGLRDELEVPEHLQTILDQAKGMPEEDRMRLRRLLAMIGE